MTKASDPKARPKVAKKEADVVVGTYDFVQSPEWQKVLEKAITQRKESLSERAQKGAAAPKPKAGQNSGDQSTTGKKPASEPKPATDQPNRAPQQSAAVSPRRASESENPSAETSDDSQISKIVRKAKAKSAEPGKQKSAPTEDKLPAPENAVPEPSQGEVNPAQESASAEPPQPSSDTQAENARDDQPSLKAGLKLSTEEVADRLRKKLLHKMGEQRRTRRKIKFGSIAVGAAIGVVASSSVFFLLSEWGASGSHESAGPATIETEVVDVASLQGREAVQLPAQQPVVASDALEQSDLLPDLLDAPTGSVPPEENPVETEELASLVGVTPALPELSENVEILEPNLVRPAPNVLASALALDPPTIPLSITSSQPRPEANPTFTRYQHTPLLFGTAFSLSDEDAAELYSIDSLINAVLTSPRPPVVSIQPVALISPEPAGSNGDHGPLPVRIAAYQPEPQGPGIALANPGLSRPDPMGVLDFVVPSPGPALTEPAADEVQTAALNPDAQADIALVPEPSQPVSIEPRAEPTDPIEPVLPPVEETEAPEAISGGGNGAEFRLYAPKSVPADTVNTVVTDLTASGHALNGTARVGFGIRQSNVRFYHRQDAARAAALAEDAGALVRDFTGSGTKTPRGIIELWLAGKGSGGSAIKRTTRKSRVTAPANNQVNQLKNQVLKKLRTATNQ